jgi:hypothetical protein
VTQTAVAAQIQQTLDVHRHFPPKITLDSQIRYKPSQLIQFRLRKLTNLRAFWDIRHCAQPLCLRSTHAKDICQRDHCMLVIRDVYTGNTCHYQSPLLSDPRRTTWTPLNAALNFHSEINLAAACDADRLNRSLGPHDCDEQLCSFDKFS